MNEPSTSAAVAARSSRPVSTGPSAAETGCGSSRFHSHFSHIEFTPKGGELRHLCFSDEGWGPEFAPLAAEVARRDWSPTFICESAGTQSEDALTMKEQYLQEEKES